MEHTYQICNQCVMDLSDSRITFDDKGICDHCAAFAKTVLGNWNPEGYGHEALRKIVDGIRRKGAGADFDCLLGLSGGVDSSFLLDVMVREYGLRPLVFHVDGGWNSELAMHNVRALVEKLKLDLKTEVINWPEMRRFQLAFFRAGVPHLDVPQDHAFVATLYRFAEKHGIKHILNGGNLSTEGVRNPLEFFYYGTDMWHINDIRSQFGAKEMPTYPFSSTLRHKVYLRYLKNVRVVKPLDYLSYRKEEAIAHLEAEYGWRPYPQKHFESRFTRFLEGYWLPSRFGFDPRRVQFSSLILTKQMTRDEALARLSEPALTDDEVSTESAFVARRLGVDDEQLEKFRVMPKKFYWDYRNQKAFLDKGAKAMRLLGLERSIKR